MPRSNWSLAGRMVGAAGVVGACTFGLVGTLLLWVGGLEGGEA